MAKFKQNNVELRDNQKLIFDSAKNKYMSYDGNELLVTTNISGVEPTEDYHLGNKLYVDTGDTALDNKIDTTSGTLQSDYIAADAVLDAKIDTTSGTLQTQVDNAESIFGSEYDYAESEGESSTTSNTYQQKLRLTTGTVPAGTYRIGWAFAYASSTDKLDCGFKIELDDTTVLSEPTPNMKGKYADGSYYGTTGLKHISLTNASHTIDIDYIANLALQVGTTYIKQARIEIWRVE